MSLMNLGIVELSTKQYNNGGKQNVHLCMTVAYDSESNQIINSL